MDGLPGRGKPAQHPLIAFGQRMPRVHDDYQAAQFIAGLQVLAQQCFPMRLNIRRHFGITVTRQIDQKSVLTQRKIIQMLCTSRCLAGVGKTRMVGQRIDRTRLACVGTPNERHFLAAMPRQVFHVIDGGKELRL